MTDTPTNAPETDIVDLRTALVLTMRYTPADWYWKADDGRLFGSARADLLIAGDAAYATWLAANQAPTPWPRDASGQQTDAALQAVLAPFGVHVALDDKKAALCADIDRQAQAVRDLYVTPGGAQAATYMFKQSQAVQAQAGQATTDAGKTAIQLAAIYPDLANEIGITTDPQTGQPASDVYGVMRAVLATLTEWLPLNRQIEATRLRTKNAIAAAATAAAAQAAHDAVAWPTST